MDASDHEVHEGAAAEPEQGEPRAAPRPQRMEPAEERGAAAERQRVRGADHVPPAEAPEPAERREDRLLRQQARLPHVR